MKRDLKLKAVSLFTGAGGMDVGMASAGFTNIWANDFDPKACESYRLNHKNPIECGDVRDFFDDLEKFRGVDLVHGGPPCQGFSVAGKMDPDDPRSELLWEYGKVVKLIKPRAFVCENVAALGRLEKWKPIRRKFIDLMQKEGYTVSFIVLNAFEFGVPQKRQRVFFIGIRDTVTNFDLTALFHRRKAPAPTVRDVFLKLGKPGTEKNQGICKAKITCAKNPIMRKSPYSGMLFNGLGRPLNPDDYSATMHASMGGNKTPFIDESQLYDGQPGWVENYHAKLVKGEDPLPLDGAPNRLRRITVSEARAIQTFPSNYQFIGGVSAQFRQIGNAVPCKLAEAVGSVVIDLLDPSTADLSNEDGNGQLLMS